MNIINALIDLFKKKENPTIQDIPQGYCPNCWGRSEYGGQFYEAVKNENVDVHSANPNVGWVQDYANKHLSKIQLIKKDSKVVCPVCKITYTPTQ